MTYVSGGDLNRGNDRAVRLSVSNAMLRTSGLQLSP
jgi:hypothetical protein